MARVNSTIYVEIDTESIVKVTCLTIDCKHNLMFRGTGKNGVASCNLKRITINDSGKCENYQRGEK